MSARFHVGEFIEDELKARGWTAGTLAALMGGENPGIDQLCIEMVMAVRDPNMLPGDDLLRRASEAFGVHPDFLGNIDRLWRATLASEQHTAEKEG